MKQFIRRHWPEIILILIWFLMGILVNPFGEFPLNDDWAYSQTVYNLVVNGRLQFSGWQSMPLIAQVLWGALFCLPLGFSYTALRLSTLVLGLVGVLACYKLFQDLQDNRWLSFIAALTIAVNPLYFSLANTFMTDVPFFSLGILAVLFFVKVLRQGNDYNLLLATIFACLATLIRQLGLVIPLAFAFGCLLKKDLRGNRLIKASFPLIFVWGTLSCYETWLKLTIGLPHDYMMRTNALYIALRQPLASFNGLFFVPVLIYLGLFLFPVLIWLFWRKSHGYLYWLGSLFWAVLMTFLFWYMNRLVPQLGNCFTPFALGPPTLRDVYVLGLLPLPRFFIFFSLLLTLIGSFGAIISLLSLFEQLVAVWYSKGWPVLFFCLGLMLFYLCPLMVPIVTPFIDRYIIFLLPLFIAILLPLGVKHNKLGLGLIFLLLAFIALFSVAGTHDYLSWNRARWQALDFLVCEQKIPASKIDGGFEFNGLYNYDPNYRPKQGKSWWWVEDDEYIVSFGPVKGYGFYKAFPYPKWLPLGQGKIYIIKRVTSKS